MEFVGQWEESEDITRSINRSIDREVPKFVTLSALAVFIMSDRMYLLLEEGQSNLGEEINKMRSLESIMELAIKRVNLVKQIDQE